MKVNLKEVLRTIGQFRKSNESQIHAIETWWNHILRKGARTFPDALREHTNERIKEIECAEIVLHFAKSW